MIVSRQLNYTKTRRFHAIFIPVIIEFSRCIGTYSSAKFELIIEKERLEKNRHILKRLADTYEKVLCIGVGSVSTVMAGAASYG